MGSRVIVASLLLPLAAASPAAEAQYFRSGPFGGAFRMPSHGGALPNAFSPYAYPGYRPDASAADNPTIGSYRTLCVRLCDGFYFPISFATPAAGLARDAEQCRASCGLEARLFYHLNPGGSVETMMDQTGSAYSALPTAFKYRKTLVAGCLCRRQPLSAAGEGAPGTASGPAAADGNGPTPGAFALRPPAASEALADQNPAPALPRPAPIVRELLEPALGSGAGASRRH
jgi:Protein of unknown function (DUF2865)